MWQVWCEPSDQTGMAWMVPALAAAPKVLINEQTCPYLISVLYETVEGSEDAPVLVGVLAGSHGAVEDEDKDYVQLLYPEEMGLEPSERFWWK